MVVVGVADGGDGGWGGRQRKEREGLVVVDNDITLH